jgi:transposase-like protein
MAKITKEFSMSVKERRYRHFSESFKQEKVKEINEGRSRIADICRAYNVSYTTIYGG